MRKILRILKKRWYIVLLIIIIISVYIYQKNSTQTKKETTYKIKKQTLRETLSLSGEINADEHAVLRFQSSGRLNWVGVKEGDYVKKYQNIASLDQRELQQNLKKYLNTFLKYRWDYDQSQDDLINDDVGSLSEGARREVLRVLDKSQYDLNNSIIDVELKNLAIEYANLFTPIEGLVVRVDSPYAGLNITPAQAEFEIINPKTIYFLATADQSDVVSLKQGMTGEISLDSFSDLNISGKISMISFIPKSGETGTVYKIKIPLKVTNTDYKFRFGMTGDVNFITQERKNIIAVPTNFVKTEKGKKYVLKLIERKKEKTFIKLGGEIDDSIEVISGLNSGDIIYTTSL